MSQLQPTSNYANGLTIFLFRLAACLKSPTKISFLLATCALLGQVTAGSFWGRGVLSLRFVTSQRARTEQYVDSAITFCWKKIFKVTLALRSHMAVDGLAPLCCFSGSSRNKRPLFIFPPRTRLSLAAVSQQSCSSFGPSAAATSPRSPA